MFPDVEILDISQPVSAATACFPGDVPFRKDLTVSYADSQVINLTAFTMSPHVGTHADAPIHIYGDMANGNGMIGQAPLSPYLGPALVVDISPTVDAVQPEHIQDRIAQYPNLPGRILFKTARTIRTDVFETAYAYFSVSLVDDLASKGVVLMGIDTPSVDHIHSKTLDAHHTLLNHRMAWLENLDLTCVEPGLYYLVALPLKMMELEASPVRAVLLKPR